MVKGALERQILPTELWKPAQMTGLTRINHN